MVTAFELSKKNTCDLTNVAVILHIQTFKIPFPEILPYLKTFLYQSTLVESTYFIHTEITSIRFLCII